METTSSSRILIGGVPFGRDNIGDEAILSTIVSIVRSLAPSATITVSTDEQESTEKLLGVKTCPLFGFDPPGFSQTELMNTLKDQDIFIWSGATGLSDYPESTLHILECAQSINVKTVVFCTGMNETLNPVKYTILPGKKKRLLELLNKMLLGNVDLVKSTEDKRCKQTYERINLLLGNCDAVINRDQQSKNVLKRNGLKRDPLVGADPAINIVPTALKNSNWSEDLKSFLSADDSIKVGLCISAQRKVLQEEELVAYLDDIVENHKLKIVFIPMNPITDAALMTSIQSKMRNAESTIVAKGSISPEEITGLTAELDLVISSRLHLLILASINYCPIIGINRGSKVSNFLSLFGREPIGSTELIDFNAFDTELKYLLGSSEAFREKAVTVRTDMLSRLEGAKELLAEVINGVKES